MSNNLKVGQILYVVPTKQVAVFPMQVVEELTKKTLDGTEIDYVLKAGGADPKTIRLKEIQGEIFESASKARTTLTERAVRSVSRLVENAAKKALEWYPGSFENSSEDSIIDALKGQSRAGHDDQARPMSENPTIVLDDGVIARVKLPDVLKG